MTDSLDGWITQSLKDRSAPAAGRPGGSAPGEEDYYAYLRGDLSEDAMRKMEGYLEANPGERDFVERLRQMLKETGQAKLENVSSRLLERAKALRKPSSGAMAVVCPHCRGKITPFGRPLAAQNFSNSIWLAAAVVSFGLSFVFPGYFIQCVAAALFCGIKWAVDRQKTKTQILIYKALTKDDEASLKEVHRV